MVYTVDPEGFVRDMLVKRGSDADCNYGMGMCLIGRKKLMELVDDCMSRNLYDFDRDLMQRHLRDLKVFGYEFIGSTRIGPSLRKCATICPPGTAWAAW